MELTADQSMDARPFLYGYLVHKMRNLEAKVPAERWRDCIDDLHEVRVRFAQGVERLLAMASLRRLLQPLMLHPQGPPAWRLAGFSGPLQRPRRPLS